QILAAEAVRREANEKVAGPSRRGADPPQRRPLVILIGDAKARLQTDVCAKLAKELGTEGVERSSLYAAGGVTDVGGEPRRDLAGGLVGEGKGADPGGVDARPLDQESNPFGQAECLPG